MRGSGLFAVVLAGCALALPRLTAQPSLGSAPAAAVPGSSSGTATGAPLDLAHATTARALDLLVTLVVRRPESLPRYSRPAFGPQWADVDHNGCDTRNDVLRRDLTAATARAGTRLCTVTSGTLRDPYTGRSLTVRDGVTGSQRQLDRGVAVDHVVALADAWRSGAAHWPAVQRVAFANDPLDLLATQATTAAAKGDADAASWLPPLASARCAFVARQVAVKARYRLSVTRAEHDALAAVLAGCPKQLAPT